ncbi:MAG TPA: hypothetical protein VGM18_00215 [Candidatus Sulfotelmatobacter sp.]|jgi:hypothetical protein
MGQVEEPIHLLHESAAYIQKKPYLKPAFRYEPVFVTSALTCGKLAGTSAHCNIIRKVS